MEQNPFEQTNIVQSTEKNLFDLQVDHETISYLGETARWAKFLAIVGFIGCGLLAILGIFFGSIFGAMGTFGRYGFGGGGAAFSILIAVLYVAMALLYFFPCFYLFNFASKMLIAIRSNDQVQLNASLRNLKSCYKFLGILTIIVLSFYALALLLGVLAGAFR